MIKPRPALFKWRHFEPEIIVCAVRWYLRFSLSYRDVEELLMERGLPADHTTIWRGVQRYAPELNQRCRRELKPTNGSWRVDETYSALSSARFRRVQSLRRRMRSAVSKGGGNSSPVGERGRYGEAQTGTKTKVRHSQGGPAATALQYPEGRVSAVRRNPKGMRRSAGP